MKIELGRYAAGLCAALMIAGCGGSQPPTAASASAQQNGIRPNVRVRETGVHPNAGSGWSPADLEAAYDLPASRKGTGQIVAAVEAYDNPSVASDLAEYRSTFGLPAANFKKYNQDGVQGDYPQGSPGWGVEIDLDVEMISASCPNCTIYLVEANSNDSSDLEAATEEAIALGAHIISIGWSCGGASCVSGSLFDKKGVEFVAASGDSGFGSGYPADFPDVVATGGTILSKGGGKRGWTESVWSDDSGGCVTGEAKPPWQHDSYCAYRLTNDTASVAVDLAEYDSYDEGDWIEVDGTSATAPFLAGVFGLAGNASKQVGARSIWEPAHHKFLYAVTSGDGGCAYSTHRYTTCTGWGSPHGTGAF